jgi:MFS family permease
MSVETAPEDAIPSAPLPKRLNVLQQLKLSSFWFAMNMHWGALLLIIIPIQTKHIAPKESAAASAWVFGIGSIMALLVPLIAGTLSDRSMSRFGRRRPFMAFGIAFDLIGLLMMWYAGAHVSLPLFILGYLIVQFGGNTAGAAYAGIIPDLVPSEQHGEASGYMATMTQAGNIIGALGSGILLGLGQPALAYLILGLVMISFLFLSLFTVHETPLKQTPAPLTFNEYLHGLVAPLKHRDFFWVLVTRGFVTLGMWCVQPFIPNYLDDVIHVKNASDMAGKLIAVILLSATVTGLLGGTISDKIGRKTVVYVANTLIAICSILFVFSHSLGYTFLIGAFYGVGYGAYFSVDWALACDVLPSKEDVGKDMGIWHVSMVLPQTFAPALAGWILSSVGRYTIENRVDNITHQIEPVKHYALAGYQTAFTAGAVFLMLGAILLRNVREKREREAAMQIEPETA